MPLSGTVILCDHVYQAQGGKFVIAGTFTTLQITVADLRRIDYQVAGLHCYIRIRPEQLGKLPLLVRIRDEQQPPWQAPLLTLTIDAQVNENNIRLIELPLTLPPFGLHIEGPAADSATPMPDTIDLRYSVELLHADELIASTPLDLHFVARPM